MNRYVTKYPWSHDSIVLVVKEIDHMLLLERVEDVGARLALVSKYRTDYQNGNPYDGIRAFVRTTPLLRPKWL